MESSTQFLKKQNNRNKWLFLLLGFGIGLIVGISLYFADIYHLHEAMNFSLFKKNVTQKETKSSPSLAKENSTFIEDSAVIEVSQAVIEDVEIPSISDNEIENEEIALKDAEFSLEAENEKIAKEEVEIFSDILLAEKRILIQYLLQDAADTTRVGKEEFFMVEQWSSPIRNKHTYYLKNNVLKLKGVNIAAISIMKYESDYYLFYNDVYYILSPNSKFERLIEMSFPYE